MCLHKRLNDHISNNDVLKDDSSSVTFFVKEISRRSLKWALEATLYKPSPDGIHDKQI